MREYEDPSQLSRGRLVTGATLFPYPDRRSRCAAPQAAEDL